MTWWFRTRLRHPLFPGLPVTLASAMPACCTILAGAFIELRDAAARGVRVSRAVCVMRVESDPPLTSEERTQLWEWFQVPGYALLMDAGGALMGYECEAVDGYHLDRRLAKGPGTAGDAAGQFADLGPRLDESLCGCGRPGPRIVGRAAKASAA